MCYNRLNLQSLFLSLFLFFFFFILDKTLPSQVRYDFDSPPQHLLWEVFLEVIIYKCQRQNLCDNFDRMYMSSIIFIRPSYMYWKDQNVSFCKLNGPRTQHGPGRNELIYSSLCLVFFISLDSNLILFYFFIFLQNL